MFLFQLDSSLIHLESRLNETQMKKFVNVVILSDHGMTYGHHSNNHSVRITKINLLSYLNREHIRSVDYILSSVVVVVSCSGRGASIKKQFVRLCKLLFCGGMAG